MTRKELQRGDLVEVRSATEILGTLDEKGDLEGLPFMPEMVACCGERFRVAARAERICDRVGPLRSLRLGDTVVLEDHRCDGSGHDGCQSDCRVFWKEAWLKRVTGDRPLTRPSADEPAALMDRVSRSTTTGDGADRRYRCQATQSLEASVPLSAKDPRSYLREVTTRNVSIPHFAKVMGHAVVVEATRKLGRLPEPVLRGPEPTSPRTPTLGLEAGDWVRVKPPSEIVGTLNDKGRNRGLWFDREMLVHCGKIFQVRRRITNFIDERTGEMVYLNSDCVSLEGSVCSGENSPSRWFCPREIYGYWREAWLERVDPPEEVSGALVATAIHETDLGAAVKSPSRRTSDAKPASERSSRWRPLALGRERGAFSPPSERSKESTPRAPSAVADPLDGSDVPRELHPPRDVGRPVLASSGRNQTI